MSKITSDIYQISEFIEEVKAKHIDAEESTLQMGLFGYLGDLFSHEIQNTIIVSSEWGNEIFPTRAKYERNIITHAIMAKVQDINATAAKMEVLFGISEEEFLSNMTDDIMYIDSETPIYIGDYEFHLDYDIKITRNTSITTGENIYIALYDMARDNRVSDITNPYLLPPYILKIDNKRYIFISTVIRQLALSKQYTKIITDDIIENKTFDFSFESQLTDFKIIINEGTIDEQELIPIFEGMPLEDPNKKYCYYTYIDSQNIRISFVRESYEPALNNSVTVVIRTTEGTSGVFKYSDDIIVKPESDKYTYTNMIFIVKPRTDSEYGIDRKSIKDLKSIIPKEILARGTITTAADLENFFNMLDDDNNRMIFLKKVDNQFERTYYSYMLLKDSDDNIIPSNTGNISILASQFDSESDSRYIIRPGSLFVLNEATDIMERDLSVYTDEEINELETNGFLYASPFFIAVNKSPLTLSFYLTLLDRRYLLLFNYINNDSFIQFIATRIQWVRRLLEDSDTYKLNMTLNQNSNENRGIVEEEEDGTIITNKLKVFLILHTDTGEPLRYIEGTLISYDSENLSYNVRFEIKTDDTITEDSSIKITNMMDLSTTNVSLSYIKSTECKTTIHILAEFDEEYGLNNLDTYIPNLEGYSLCNTYEVEGGIDFFVNYTDIVQSKVSVEPSVDDVFTLKSIPVVKYTYTQDPDSIRFLVEHLISKKIYIDDIQEVLGDQFGIDLKFFNTYGVSKAFTIGYDKHPLDRTNITLNFRAKVSNSAPENIKDLMISYIKVFIEDINDINDVHISKLITEVTNKFLDLVYIEFLGINNYDTTYQYIEKRDIEGYYIPEFLNINSTDIDYNPDIQIDLV